MRGRKIDQMRGRKKKLCAERERGSWELGTERREKKWLKNYMHMLQYPCKYLHLYTSLHRLMWEFFLLMSCKMSTFFHFAQFYINWCNCFYRWDKTLKGKTEGIRWAGLGVKRSTSRSHALSTRPTNFFFPLKLSLKMSPTTLFTYLKIILLQYFQFLVFSN